ncbi:MAG: hypothetical protein HY893_01635 [Deltaproteobacteria bacterium]|nr:hypothetical protein [Deltaproteobacteria bacterium]
MLRILGLFDFFSIFSNIPTIFASIGLILATSSFISGLQLVRAASLAERKIHRFNGLTTFTLYISLAVLAFAYNGVRFWPLIGWVSGLCLFLLKIWIVRRKRRVYKYVSWMGATLILVWLFLVYIHIPV